MCVYISVMFSGPLGDQSTSLGTQKTLFKFFFLQLYFNKKYIEVAIDDFTMHLIILKLPERQTSRQKRKTMRQKEVQAKKETVYEKVFIHLNMYYIFPLRK